MPAAIGIRARTAAPSDQSVESPAASVPSMMATRVSGVMLAASWLSSTASGAKLSATVRKPAALNIPGVPRQSTNLAQGSEKTAPILTLIDRRYSGSAARGESRAPSHPRPAAFLRIAPTLV